MLRLLIDTSAWLDLAKRRDGQRWIVLIRVLQHQRRLELLVPQLVRDEYARNCGRIETAMTNSVSDRFRLLRQDLADYGGADQAASIELARGLEHQVPLIGAMTTRNFDEIAELLTGGMPLVPDADKDRRVVERGIAKKAPFIGTKNSTADSVLTCTVTPAPYTPSAACVPTQ